jgi:hypothetical protein
MRGTHAENCSAWPHGSGDGLVGLQIVVVIWASARGNTTSAIVNAHPKEKYGKCSCGDAATAAAM